MPKKNSMPAHYRIKYRQNGTKEWKYGIHDGFSDEAKKLWKKGQLLIEDAVTPKTFAIDPNGYEIVDIKKTLYVWEDEMDDYVTAEFEKAYETSKNSKSIIGKMFDVGVADGSAYYVVVGNTSSGYAIEWRGFCPDRWVDHAYGYGGTFPKKMIKREVKSYEGMAQLFS